MQQEIKKKFHTKIIYPIKYPKWMDNLVLVRKKNGDIRLCVDF